MRKLLVRLATTLFILAVGGMGALYYMLHHYGSDLPDYNRLADYEPPTVTRVHAGDGRLLAEFATERRVFVPIEAMPRRLVNAFLAAEDKNFFEHRGIDLMGILRATINNFERLNSDRRPMGASTITQQVAKNMLLTSEVSMARKVKEAILALRIEQALPKDRILELYLNQIFLGNRSYGVAAASLNYFNKSLDDLSIAEVAYLAALPKAPNNYNPERQYEAAIGRRNWVIGRMAEDGYITQEEARKAMEEPLATRRRDATEVYTADYYAEEVRRELAKLFGDKQLYEGGLSVRTPLDPRLQDIATRALRGGLITYDRRHGWRGAVTHLPTLEGWPRALAAVPMPKGGEAWQLAVVLETKGDGASLGLSGGQTGRIPMAELRWARSARGGDPRRAADVVKVGDVVLVEPLSQADARGREPVAGTFGLRQIPAVQGGMVAIDPHTGRVLAMVGGFSPTMSQFNRATQALRQPGSSFKPFVYLTALDNGFTPSSLVLDAPFEYNPGHGQAVWRPDNYDQRFLGPTTIRVGIEKSRNLMTVRLAEHIGMDKVKDTVERFGVVDNLQPYLPMALGAAETTVMRLTTAYAMLVNGGRKLTPALIDRVQDRNGRTIYRHDSRTCQGCSGLTWDDRAVVPEVADNREQIEDPRTCYQIVNIMTGVVQRGTAARLAALGRPMGGKTGTTNDSNDAWFVGFTPDLVVGLYVGFDQPESLGGQETGGRTAVPIFEKFMVEALRDKPVSQFRVPPGVRLVRVSPDSGRPTSSGERGILEAFLPGTEPGASDESVLGGAGAGYGTGGLAPDSDPSLVGTDTYTGSTAAPPPTAAGAYPGYPEGAVPYTPYVPYVPRAGGGGSRPATPSAGGGATDGGGGLY